MKRNMFPVIMMLAAVVFSGCAKKAEKGEFTLEKGKLRIGTEVGYPPFEYYADDGKTILGFDAVLGAAVAERLGLEPVFIDTAWDGIFAGLDTERYDVIMSSVTITPERSANYDFSEPYIGNGQAIILRKDSVLPIKSPADLENRKVGYQAECTSDFFMDRQAAAGLVFTPSEYDKVMNAYDDLRLGRIDAVVSDSLVAVSYLTKPDSEFVQVWEGVPDEHFAICLKKGNSVLQSKINSVLADMKKDGTLASIYMEIFGMDLSDSIKDAR